MKKYFYCLLIAAALFPAPAAFAQCSVSVPATPFPLKEKFKSYVQTFKPTCSGNLKNIVFPNIYRGADNFRATGYFVTCRIKDAAGNILGTAPRTDQWYPGATVTFDFLCTNTNVGLVSGTTYQFELTAADYNDNPSSFPVFLLCRSSFGSGYADGFCILDGTAYPDDNLFGWTVNLATGSIASSNSSATQTITPCVGFYNAANEILVSVLPGSTNGIAGSITAKVWIESTQPSQFVKRHYEITPATNATTATATVTLYFTQPEFDAYNAVNTVKLPTGPADASGKANLLIEKRSGTSSNGSGLPDTYTGTPVTIDPADANIVWNSAVSRWEVSFNVTGFSGFFVNTSTVVLPLKWLSITGSVNPQGYTVLNWKVNEIYVADYEIEKSTDANYYRKIGGVISLGDGTHNYSFTEADKLIGNAYYRIKQIDFDRRASYSAIVKLTVNNKNTFLVYPTPAQSVVSVNVPASMVNTNALLKDITGRTMAVIKLEAIVSVININNYSSGTYILYFENGMSAKFIKQ